MIPFARLDLHKKQEYERFLRGRSRLGCEYSFVNQFLWGRQKSAVLDGHLVFLSQYDRRSVYPFPIGSGDIRPVLDAIIGDARARGIPCCLSCMSKEDCALLEQLYPGRFRFHSDRDSYDYIYAIDDLADLKGRKYQKKRTHLNRFADNHPTCRVVALDESTRAGAYCMLQNWYARRTELDPSKDFYLERTAMDRAFAFQSQLGLEGIVLMDDSGVLAFAMGSFLSEDTFDIHFEKAREDIQGCYAAINRAFARHLREKYPQLRWLNREDDLGIEGLRKAKLDYCPALLLEKYWARLWEDEDEI